MVLFLRESPRRLGKLPVVFRLKTLEYGFHCGQTHSLSLFNVVSPFVHRSLRWFDSTLILHAKQKWDIYINRAWINTAGAVKELSTAPIGNFYALLFLPRSLCSGLPRSATEAQDPRRYSKMPRISSTVNVYTTRRQGSLLFLLHWLSWWKFVWKLSSFRYQAFELGAQGNFKEKIATRSIILESVIGGAMGVPCATATWCTCYLLLRFSQPSRR